MSYYREKKQANRVIDDLVESVVLDNNQPLNIDRTILEITRSFEISEKAVQARLYMLARAHSLEVRSGELQKIAIGGDE